MITNFFKLPFLFAFILLLSGCSLRGGDTIFGKFSKEGRVKAKTVLQYDAIAVWQNNSEGNWDIAYSIYKQSDNSWLHLPDRDIFYEGNANLIAKLPGDDNDPDIASTKHTALAVWSNSGAEGNNGADVYFARWSPLGWSEPARLFALPGDDLDPTIYMQSPGRAMVVWINRQNARDKLFYSEYDNGHWTEPKDIEFSASSEISSPELGYVTLPFSRYLLVFTAQNQKGEAYLGIYDRVNGWEVNKMGSANSAVVDKNIPNSYRTSAAMHVASHKVAATWGGVDGQVWQASASPVKKDFSVFALSDGNNPVMIFDPSNDLGTDSIIYNFNGNLVNQTPSVGGSEQVISANELGNLRPDATYLVEQNSRTALAVWNSHRDDPGEIYFSAVDKASQKWSEPGRIDKKVFPGDDKNPAIAPILVRFDKNQNVLEEDEYAAVTDFCGDKVLQKKWEECEIGIACKKPDRFCDWDYYTKNFGKAFALLFADCECLIPEDQIDPPLPFGGDDGQDEPEQDRQNDNVVYGGASCGFDKIVLKSAIGTGQVDLQFLPETSPANGIVAFNGGYPQYQVEKFALFPLSEPPHDKYYVMVNFSSDNNTITMTGIDAVTGSQLCTGTFTKGAKPEGGGFVPAPAPAGSEINVPTLP